MLRAQVGQLLESLRGDLSRSAMARELQMTRQAVMGLERGVVSLERLEQLEATYGVRFALVALPLDWPDSSVASVAGLTTSPRLAALAAADPSRRTPPQPAAPASS